MKVALAALAELNRAEGQRPPKRPGNPDLPDPRARDHDADLIVFIYRDEVYNKETGEKGKAEIIVG